MSETRMHAERHGEHAEINPLLVRMAQFMARMHVAPLPRNYELFYQVLSGASPDKGPEIGKAILALGNAPTQTGLDEIGRKYQLAGHIGTDAGEALAMTDAAIGQMSSRVIAATERMKAIGQSAASPTASRDELVRLINDMVTEQQSLERFIRHGLETVQECRKGIAGLRVASLRDALTTLPNRLALSERLDEIFAENNRTVSAVLVVINIDRFRDINADFGTEAGNRALRRLAAVFRRSIKKSDFLARSGGDEFSFLLFDIPPHAMENVAGRLRRSVEDLPVTGGNRGQLGASVGIADLAGASSAAEFYNQAELALLAARCNGKNRVVCYSREVARRSRQSYLAQLGT